MIFEDAPIQIGATEIKSGSLTARQVRFDGDKAICERRVTVMNSLFIDVRGHNDVLDAAKSDLGEQLAKRLGL